MSVVLNYSENSHLNSVKKAEKKKIKKLFLDLSKSLYILACFTLYLIKKEFRHKQSAQEEKKEKHL